MDTHAPEIMISQEPSAGLITAATSPGFSMPNSTPLSLSSLRRSPLLPLVGKTAATGRPGEAAICALLVLAGLAVLGMGGVG